MKYLHRHLFKKTLDLHLAHRDIGIRRWDISKDFSLFCSAHPEWYNGPIIQKGWTVHITWMNGDRKQFVTLNISREDAHNILITAYGEWIEDE